MKKYYVLVIALVFLSTFFISNKINAQTISDFENLTLVADTFWNGSDLSGSFISGNVVFHNTYNTSWSIWESGFAYSDMKDTVTQGYTNLYSARTGIGYNNSANYGVVQNNAVLHLTGAAAGKLVNGFYVTNSNYAAFSMQDGDSFAKKFGGISGNDLDWFKLSITGYKGCCAIEDTVHFYLADYRFADSSQDYILKTWEWVDLTSLGNVDSLIFILNSSDTGSFGMNTPAFFCIDNFITADSYESIDENKMNTFLIYPNPADESIYINIPDEKNIGEISIYDMQGKKLYFCKNFNTDNSIDISKFTSGIYMLNIGRITKKLIIK